MRRRSSAVRLPVFAAGQAGLEPAIRRSERRVLPLHHRPIAGAHRRVLRSPSRVDERARPWPPPSRSTRGGHRTRDLVIKSHLLFHLSFACLVEVPASKPGPRGFTSLVYRHVRVRAATVLRWNGVHLQSRLVDSVRDDAADRLAQAGTPTRESSSAQRASLSGSALASAVDVVRCLTATSSRTAE